MYDIDASADQPRTNSVAEVVASAEGTTTAASGLVIIDDDDNSGLPVPIGMVEASLNNSAKPTKQQQTGKVEIIERTMLDLPIKHQPCWKSRLLTLRK